MPRHLFALLLGLAFLVPDAAAQNASISGYVRDAGSGETMINATVFMEGTSRGSTTNVQGFYTVGGLEPGSYRVRYSFIGYERVFREVTLAAGQTLRLDVELAQQNVEGGEVVVTAEQPIEEERAVGLQEVPIRLVQELPTVFEADLFRSIQLLPGVKAASDFSSALYIRGGSPDQTLILLDGTTVYNPTHFFGFFSTFNTDAIKDVKLYKGAYPSTYGGRLGSVIDIYNRDGNRNRTAGNLTLGILASRVGIEGPIAGGRGSYMFAGRRSTLEPLLAVLRNQLPDSGIPDGFYFYDVNAKVGMDLSQNDRVSLSGYAGRDRVDIAFGDDASFLLDYGNRTASLGYNRVLSGTAFAQARATASHYFSRPVGSFAGTEFTRPNTITDYSARTDIEWLPGEKFEARAGIWGGSLDLSLRSEFNGSVSTDFSNPSRYAAAYTQGKVMPAPGWILTGGLRGEFFRSATDDLSDTRPASSASYFRLAPQLQVERKFGEDLILQAAGGRYYQFLSLISQEAFTAFDTWVTTGVGVPPSSSEQFVLGLKTRLSPAYRLDVEVYGRTLRDLFDIDPGTQDVSGLPYAELFRFGDGYAYGAEFLLERGLGRLTGLVSYTLGVTRKRYPDQPGLSDYFAPKYDRLHDLTAVANYQLGRGWKFTAAAAFATGQAYTVPSGRYEINGLPFGDGSANGLYSSLLNGARLPNYHRVDLGFTRTGRFFGLGKSELQLQVVNVYSRRNVWFFNIDFDDNPVSQTAVRQLPILPNISLSLAF